MLNSFDVHLFNSLLTIVFYYLLNIITALLFYTLCLMLYNYMNLYDLYYFFYIKIYIFTSVLIVNPGLRPCFHEIVLNQQQ